MTTATDALKQNEEARRAHILNQTIEGFTRRWGPEDRDELAGFSADLFSLVRTIYLDAQEPSHRHVEKILSRVVMPPSFWGT